MDKYIGKRLEGRYDILEIIGKGGMANVYRAYDNIDDKTVAVKILREEYVNNTDFLRRFKNESKAIAVLNHPNIVKVHDVSFSGINYIVMEYIDGVTLKEYIEHVGRLPYKDAVHFTIQILQALQHAHDKGIVHRDIKPQNIMLLKSGKIKVTDFGIARFARSESRTISDRAIGSVHYISPEQAMGEYTDEKSDIYSTGIMFYEMLTGKLPFEADTAVSVAIKQIQSPIKRPSSIVPDLPLGLEEITLKSVQKDAASRYQSAAEMIVALEAFRANPSIRFGYVPSKPISLDNGVRAQSNAPSNSDTDAREEKSEQRGERETKIKEKKVKKKNPYLRTMFILTLIISLASAAFVGIMIMMNNPFVSADDDTLPNFVGQTYADVAGVYPDFVFEEIEGEYSDEYNLGVIYEQSPKANSSVKLGSKVKVYVSKGKEELLVESFEGEPAARVLSVLRNLGLVPTEVRENHEDVPAGRVITTDPAPGSILTGGDSITLRVSKGPEKKHVSLPDVVGMTIEDAKTFLEEQEFVIDKITEVASDLPEGTVVSQNPPAGTMHYVKDPIQLEVSKGGMVRLMIPIQLPTNMNREVTIRARVGEGDAPPIGDETLMNPSQSPTGVWNPQFSGEAEEQLRIRVYIDGKLYQDIMLDFATGRHEITRDYSNTSHFQR